LVDFDVFSLVFLSLIQAESTFYRNCYLWLRFNDNNTNFQDYKPNLVIKKIIEYGCNTTAKEETCAFEGINLPGPPGGMKFDTYLLFEIL
jgi:hypothetical protein